MSKPPLLNRIIALPVRQGLVSAFLIGLCCIATPVLALEAESPAVPSNGYSSTRGHLAGIQGIDALLDLLVVVLLGYIVVRLWKAHQSKPLDPVESDTEAEHEFGPGQESEARRRATHAWDHLRTRSRDEASPSTPGQEKPVPPPFPSRSGTSGAASPPPGKTSVSGFDSADFLRGAKIVYSRIRESLAAGDLPDVKSFVTPDLYERLLSRAPAAPGGTLRVMLVEASILDVQETPEQLQVRVHYDASVHSDTQASPPAQRREIWRFIKTKNNQDVWLLADIEQQA